MFLYHAPSRFLVFSMHLFSLLGAPSSLRVSLGCLGCGRRRASLGPPWCARASSGPVALGAPVGFPVAVVPSPTGGSLGTSAGHVEAGREPDSRCLPLAPGEAGTLSWLRSVPVRGPTMYLSLVGPSGVRLGRRALRWFGVCGPGHTRFRFPLPFVV